MDERQTRPGWRVRFGIAVGLVVLFCAFIALAVAHSDWVAAAIFFPFTGIAVARVWLMTASLQPVSYLGTVVILLNGPRRFITDSGVRKRSHDDRQRP